MGDKSRAFYHSSNGDFWSLMVDFVGAVRVVHTPNAASGGMPRVQDIGDFLSRKCSTPQGQELTNLIGGLVDEEPNA